MKVTILDQCDLELGGIGFGEFFKLDNVLYLKTYAGEVRIDNGAVFELDGTTLVKNFKSVTIVLE